VARAGELVLANDAGSWGRNTASGHGFIQAALDPIDDLRRYADLMLDLANDIRSLSDFKRNTVDLLDRIRKTGNPMVLTINGKAELVVQDAEAYQALLDRVETLEGIQRGVADVKAGRTKPAPQVFDKLRRKHGIPR
jgi:prevent-host-death family protein